ncbi:MAG: TetR/AcrR family transcriptional regulator [Pseudomonadota bacterium]
MAKSRWISDLQWVRTGQQSRSQKTQELLLDAAEVLFSEQGVDATSVADVAARAKCSVGAVYHHFKDKKTLLYAIFERMSERYQATTRDAVDPERWDGASITDILQGYLEFSLEAGRNRPVFKQAGIEASRNDPKLRENLLALYAEANEGITKLLLARRDEIGHPAPELAIDFVLDQLGSMIKTRLDELILPTQLAKSSDAEFIRESLRSVCGYLQVKRPAELTE